MFFDASIAMSISNYVFLVELGSNIERVIPITCRENDFVLNLRTAAPESSNL